MLNFTSFITFNSLQHNEISMLQNLRFLVSYSYDIKGLLDGVWDYQREPNDSRLIWYPG